MSGQSMESGQADVVFLRDPGILVQNSSPQMSVLFLKQRGVEYRVPDREQVQLMGG